MGQKPAHSLHRCLLLAIAIGLLPPLTGCRWYKADPKIAFLGDSITEQWHYPKINLGIYGETTAQILERFSTEIPGHGYKQVVILGGTNDVLLGIDPAVTIHHLELLGNDTIRAGAQPILCEIPPILYGATHDGKADPRYSQPVRQLNADIVHLAAQHGWSLVDYYDPLLGHPSYYSSDGVHLRRRAYLVMEYALLRGDRPISIERSGF